MKNFIEEALWHIYTQKTQDNDENFFVLELRIIQNSDDCFFLAETNRGRVAGIQTIDSYGLPCLISTWGDVSFYDHEKDPEDEIGGESWYYSPPSNQHRQIL